MLSSPAIAVSATLGALHTAWRHARHGKRPSVSQMQFDARWVDGLLELQAQLRAGQWWPRRTVSFVVRRPKTREIHAPHFADRVLHHWLVPQLEALYEPVFIHDSYANRKGKGSHAAADRLQTMMRQQQGLGWFLQLDVHNCFNSVHRPTLYALLCARLERAQRQGRITAPRALALRSLCHRLLSQPNAQHCLNPQQAARVPAHKRLVNAAPGCGIPIGNLSSQFFANVVLNELDQFVKHQLKVRHYVRYVDDFVLLAHDAATLQQHRQAIEDFLHSRLKLRLKDAPVLAPLAQGCDFLGYWIWATHRRVRGRVTAHCRQRLQAWARGRVRQEPGPPATLHIVATPKALQALQATLGSYWGHFGHAQSHGLKRALWQEFAWLQALFDITPDGRLCPRWTLEGATFSQQCDWLRARWPGARCQVQKGAETLRFGPAQPAPILALQALPAVIARQTGWLRHGGRRREICEWHLPLVAGEAAHSSAAPSIPAHRRIFTRGFTQTSS